MALWAKVAFLVFLPLLTLAQPKPADTQLDGYLSLLKGKRVALVANHTAVIEGEHLLDLLLENGVKVSGVFSPEHGFRGDASAGATVANGVDTATGVPIFSLYGATKKPTPQMLKDVDLILFDIQDVGARFYTYISTLHYVMEACGELKKPLIVLDRPNPNGFYVDGPVLEKGYTSFVGMHPVPIVHGMTIGEYARMINGERWIPKPCSLTVIPCIGYTHADTFLLPIPPSPNLPTQASIYLYPSLCLFEGTDVSVGRGTPWPFEFVGKPDFTAGLVSIVPQEVKGKAIDPPHEGDTCRGFILSRFAFDYIKPSGQLYLYWLTGMYADSEDKGAFFNDFFDKLAGTSKLREQVIAGMEPDKIRETWKAELAAFKTIRAKYLLYQDF